MAKSLLPTQQEEEMVDQLWIPITNEDLKIDLMLENPHPGSPQI
jgi:hypothetical protein